MCMTSFGYVNPLQWDGRILSCAFGRPNVTRMLREPQKPRVPRALSILYTMYDGYNAIAGTARVIPVGATTSDINDCPVVFAYRKLLKSM